MDDWSRDEWQGRRRDQVEGSMRTFGLLSLLLLLFLLSFAGVLIVDALRSLH